MPLAKALDIPMENIDSIEQHLGINLPETYKRYISSIENYRLVEFKGQSEKRDWYIYGVESLTEGVILDKNESVPFHSCLGAYLKSYFEFIGKKRMIKSVQQGYVEPERVAKGFVIGTDNGDYLYLDPSEGYSVWVFYHDGTDIKRLTHNFKYFVKHCQEVESDI